MESLKEPLSSFLMLLVDTEIGVLWPIKEKNDIFLVKKSHNIDLLRQRAIISFPADNFLIWPIFAELRYICILCLCFFRYPFEKMKRIRISGKIKFRLFSVFFSLVSCFFYSINTNNQPFFGKFRGLSLGCDNEIIVQGRSYVDRDINIYDCFFSRFSEISGNGGVIYVNSGSFIMSISYSMFYNCSSSNSGGAIYFCYSPKSVLKMICAHRCSSITSHFANIQASQENQLEYLSISLCSHTQYGYYPIYLVNGDQRVEKTNISVNIVFLTSGIAFWSPSSFISSYCTFSNNKASNSICLYIYSNPGTISFSNIIQNNSPSNYGVVYVHGGSPKLHFCVFYFNENTLFCVEKGSLEVSHSFIFHSAMFSTSTTVSTSVNNSFIKSQTYQIQFFKSNYCNADIPIKITRSVNTFSDSIRYKSSFFSILIFIIS